VKIFACIDIDIEARTIAFALVLFCPNLSVIRVDTQKWLVSDSLAAGCYCQPTLLSLWREETETRRETPFLARRKRSLVTRSLPSFLWNIYHLHLHTLSLSPGYPHIQQHSNDFSLDSVNIAYRNLLKKRKTPRTRHIASMSLTPRGHSSSNIHYGSGRGFIVLRRSPRERLWVDYDPAVD
jgi:hypothetical protein